jgi:hypothetical protein
MSIGSSSDLEAAFGTLAASLPENGDEEPGWMVLSADNLPVPADCYTTSRLCMTWSYKLYNDHPVELVSLEIDKPTCRHLGLLILSTLFHPEPERVEIHLDHQRSTIRRLVLDRWSWNSDNAGLLSRPWRFNFYPAPPTRYPWLSRLPHPGSLPCLSLTNEEEMILRLEDLPHRNVAVGFGPPKPAALFAELLLNASLPACQELEFSLEGECGNRGVGPGSAEIQIWLPGSVGYLDREPALPGR